MNIEQKLQSALAVLLDQVDSLTEMVGAVLPEQVIKMARAALAESYARRAQGYAMTLTDDEVDAKVRAARDAFPFGFTIGEHDRGLYRARFCRWPRGDPEGAMAACENGRRVHDH